MDITMKDIEDFPSKQAEEIQKHLLELDSQGKLKEEFLSIYGNNLGKPNSLANYILKNWEKDGKKLFIEWTGIETLDDKHTIKRTGVKLNKISYASNRYFLWKCSTCQHEWVIKVTTKTAMKSGCPECAKRSRVKASHLR